MSFILDALRRSDRARRALGGALQDVPLEARHARQRAPWLAIVTALLAVNAALVGAFLYFKDDAPAADAAAVAPAAALSDATAPADASREVRPLAGEAGEPMAPADTFAAAPDPSPETTPPDTAPAPAVAPVSLPPTLAEFPPAFTGRLPKLHMDVHSFADDPRKRFVLVNLKRYSEGERLAEGPSVIAIVPEGVVLELDGTRFLLPRG